jgi:hypothetical protein
MKALTTILSLLLSAALACEEVQVSLLGTFLRLRQYL